MSLAPRIGLLAWDQGQALAQALDWPGLLLALGKQKDVKLVLAPTSLGQGRAELAAALAEGQVERLLVLGAPSHTQRQDLLAALAPAGLNPHLAAWLDLEAEGVLDLGLPAAQRQKKALTLVKMHLALLRLAAPLEPVEAPATRAALVLGGGVAGLEAAKRLAACGVEVHLAERAASLGGRVAQLSGLYPLGCDPLCGLVVSLRELCANGQVHIHTLSQLTDLAGAPGAFSATLSRAPRFVDPELCNGCGQCATVCPVEVPAAQAWWQDEPPVNPRAFALAGLKPAKAIGPGGPLAFPPAWRVRRELCPPGCRACAEACPSRALCLEQGEEHFTIEAGALILATGWDPYPLSRLERWAYQQSPRVVGNLELERLLSPAGAAALAGMEPRTVAFIQCAGSRDQAHLPYCSGVCCSASLKQARRLKELYPDLLCYVFYQDIRTLGFEEDLYRQVAALPGVVLVRGLPAQAQLLEDGRLGIRAEDAFSGVELKLRLDLLVLAGGMTPSAGSVELAARLGLPPGPHGFYWSHPQCRPADSGRNGIFAAGCGREPMNVTRSLESAALAACHALPLMSGQVRLAPHLPRLDKGKCDQCKRCLEECPAGAWSLDERGFPLLAPTRCRQCGVCMGACPLAAISLPGSTIRQMAAAIEVLGDDAAFAGQAPLVLALLCQNDAWLAARQAARAGLALPPGLVMLPLTCAGALNNALVADALSLGVDGVLIGGCPGQQCHYRTGGELASRRARDLGGKLTQMRLEPQRVRFEPLEVGQAEDFARLAAGFAQELKALGPNPFRM
ncbi:MAG: hydrogenase iron-sulfur subunit [Desulfarculus sp.]|nr:hydrogenase iron-sulfur subunit [Desulfarculus sp.]